jgi:gliding motility-associated-like protein
MATGNAIQWFLNSTGGAALNSTTALTTQTYYAEQTDPATLCKSTTRTSVNVTVLDPSAPITNATQTFCNSAKISDLNATGTNVKWYLQSTGGIALDPTSDLTDGTYYASQTLNNTISCESTTRASTIVTITKTPAPSGSGNQLVCNSGTISNLVAAGTSILWYANATGGSPLNPSTALVNGTTYYASQTLSSCESSNRYPLAVTITNPALPTSAGNQSVCQTNPIQTLIPVVTSPDGGTITWYDAPTGGNLIASPAWNSIGSTTFYAQNNNNSCTSTARTPVALEIKAAPLLTITNTTCAANLLTYSVAFNASAGTNISVVPNVGTVSASGITNIPAGTNITINANVAGGCNEVIPITAPDCSCPIVATPSASANQTICEGQNNPTLSVSVAAQETADWYTTQTGGAPFLTNALNFTPTVTAAGNYTYYVEARNTTTNCTSTTRIAVTLTIEGIAAPSGAANQTFCQIDTPTIANLVASGTNIKWYNSPTSTTPLATTTPLTDATYYATQTATNGLGCESVNRFAVAVTITKTPAPSGSGNQVVCNSGTIGDLIASGTSILWYANPSGGSPLNPTTALVNGATYYASQTLSACESVNRLSVSVVINQPISPIIQNEESFCASENATITSLTNRVTNTNTVNWYLTPNSTTPLSVTDKLVNGAIYYGAAFTSTPLFCESSPRTTVKVNIESPSKPEGNSNQFFCNSSLPKIKDLIVTSGVNVKWYDNNNTLLSNDFALVDGGKYYATQTIGICESVERFEVTVSILSPATPTTNANTQLFCIEQNPTLNSIAITKSNPLSNIKWYDSLTGGNLLPNDTALLNGNSYYAVEESINPIVCQSNNRLKVDIIIESAATPIVSSIEAPTCAKTTGSVILTGLPNGNWEIIPSSGASVFGTGATYKFENLSAGVSYNFKVKTANQCASQASIEAIIPVVPLYPNAATIDVTQPTCLLPHGKIEFSQQTGMEYSIGGSYQTNPLFDNLQPGIYKTSIRNSTSVTCMINTEEVVINPIPKTIAFELKSYCLQNEFIVEIIPLNNSFSLNQVEITWIDKNQNSVGNDAKLNVTKTIGAIDDSIYPLEFTAKVANTATGCETSQTISLSSVFCDIQKGISPDGNGSNEYFDLSTFSVKNISIFNRYGVEVYRKKNYKNEWRGQTNDGTSLPDGTYYYIITFNDETSKTGWIYVTKK